MEMTAYFTSDLHLGHVGVLAFAQRPWATIEEHDAAIIGNINSVVGPGDELYILGDFTFKLADDEVKAYLDAIHCEDRWLVLGNHDEAPVLRRPDSFAGVAPYMEVEEGGRLCCLSHYPMLDWNRMAGRHGIPKEKASLMLHGHIHSQGRAYNGDNAREGIWRYDVGVDANGYKPVSLEEIEAFIRERDPYFRRDAPGRGASSSRESGEAIAKGRLLSRMMLAESEIASGNAEDFYRLAARASRRVALKNLADQGIDVGRIVSTLRGELDVKAIYAFGSRVRGDYRDRSDLDLLVVTAGEADSFIGQSARARKALRWLRMEKDVLAMDETDFDRGAEDESTIEGAAKREGVLLYER